jgi:hypothetical protein
MGLSGIAVVDDWETSSATVPVPTMASLMSFGEQAEVPHNAVPLVSG